MPTSLHPLPKWWKRRTQTHPIWRAPFLRGSKHFTPASPEWYLQSYFLPFAKTPIKHTNCCREFLGWFFFFPVDLLSLFFISNTEKSPGPCGAPHTHPLSPTLTALLPTANLLQRQHFFPHQTINIQFLACSAEPEESSASFIFRQFIWHQVPVISKLSKALFYTAQLEPSP